LQQESHEDDMQFVSQLVLVLVQAPSHPLLQLPPPLDELGVPQL